MSTLNFKILEEFWGQPRVRSLCKTKVFGWGGGAGYAFECREALFFVSKILTQVRIVLISSLMNFCVSSSGFDINELEKEAQTRWLKPAEVFFILQNHESRQLTQKAPDRPTSKFSNIYFLEI